MTTLDPHDFEQKTLDIPLKDIVLIGKKLADITTTATAAFSLATGNFAGIVAAVQQKRFSDYLEKALNTAEKLGIKISPIQYGDFKDPNVKVWQNVDFADNYYQKGATETPDAGALQLVTSLVLPSSFTFTPNGTSIAGADIDLKMSGITGFQNDDYQIAGFHFGLGGPHSRVWQWYAGTIDTQMTDFQNGPIFRRISDEGLSMTALGLPTQQKFTNESWYWVNPVFAQNGALSTVETNAAPFDPLDPSYIREGVGIGWYYSALGGGEEFRPDAGAAGEPLSTDNTEVEQYPEVVPTIFNGDFEHGTKQSFLKAVEIFSDQFAGIFGDRGRFPLSYELPGWSFHGGEGFSISFSVAGYDFFFDLAALFVVETNPVQLLKSVVDKAWDIMADKLIEAAAQRIKVDQFGAPPAPDSNSSPGYTQWYNDRWVPSGANVQLANAQKFLLSMDKLVGDLFNLGLTNIPLKPGTTLAPGQTPKMIDVVAIDPNKKISSIGIANLKEYIKQGLGELLKAIFPPDPVTGTWKSDYALMMGGQEIIDGLINAFVPDGLSDLFVGLFDDIVNFNQITHNRFYVPETGSTYLNFEAFTPFVASEAAKLSVIFESDDAGSFAPIEVPLEYSFFGKKTYSVEVPADLKGKIATVSFKHEGVDIQSDLFLYPEDFVDSELPQLGLAISQMYFLDAIRLSDVNAGGTPLYANAEGAGAPVLTLDQAKALAEVAIGSWADSTLLPNLDNIEGRLSLIDIEVADLNGRVLAVYDNGVLKLDADAAGHGWYVDPAPLDNGEFDSTDLGWVFNSGLDGDAAGRIDLLTVLAHEFGHALGLRTLRLACRRKP
jgi:hypothetical protein